MEEHAEILKFYDGNFRLEEAYREVAEKILVTLGYEKNWMPFYHDVSDYICTVESTQEEEPDLAYYENQSAYNLVKSNRRMTTRMDGIFERFLATHYPHWLQTEDNSHWVTLLYVNQEFDEKICDKDEPCQQLQVDDRNVLSRHWNILVMISL